MARAAKLSAIAQHPLFVDDHGGGCHLRPKNVGCLATGIERNGEREPFFLSELSYFLGGFTVAGVQGNDRYFPLVPLSQSVEVSIDVTTTVAE